MKKKLISILLIMTLAVTILAGCGSKEEPAADQPEAAALSYSDIMIGEITSLVVNDGGWCQATHESLLASMKEL